MTKLQDFRVKNEISQFELAKRSEVSIQAIQAYEQMKRPIEGCRISSLLRMSQVLGVYYWELFEDKSLADQVVSQARQAAVQGTEC